MCEMPWSVLILVFRDLIIKREDELRENFQYLVNL